MISPIRIQELTDREQETFRARTKASLELAQRGIEVLPQAVPSSVAALYPYPLAIVSGRGAEATDIDGNSYVDYWNGFGTSVFGHAHPAIVEAIQRRAELGTHFGAVSTEAVEWAEVLCARLGLNWIRFGSSGTEATMDAFRLARAQTGRPLIAKIEGGYHGAHPEALHANNLPLDGSEGPEQLPASRPLGEGISANIAANVVALPFNDLEAAGRLLGSGRVAGLIVEPILFNVGAIWPAAGYLEGLREICDETGTVLIFDEVKTGVTVAYGGASELFGVRPDLKCLGKGIGGGIGSGAIGGTSAWGFELIDQWRVPQLSTFGGNPLAAAAGLVAMREVLHPSAYEGLEEHRRGLTASLERTIGEFELPAYVVGAGAKGCVVWSPKRLSDFRDYKRNFDFELGNLAWLWLINRGVLLAPGQDEQWTHSVSHGPAEAARFAGAFAELAAELRS